MKRRYIVLLVTVAVFILQGTFMAYAKGNNAAQRIQDGWEFLKKDEDSAALLCFHDALQQSTTSKDTLGMAEALLSIGISQYGNSLAIGQSYANKAADLFRLAESAHPDRAHYGLARTKQLMATIQGRQKQWAASIALSREALHFFKSGDAQGSLGLAYNSMGASYFALRQIDSAEYYFQKAIKEFSDSKNNTYLPGALNYIAMVLVSKGKFNEALEKNTEALLISVASNNRQAAVTSRTGMANLYCSFLTDYKKAAAVLDSATRDASALSDKSFLLKVLEARVNLYAQQGLHKDALEWERSKNELSDSVFSMEKHRQLKQLEIEFQLSEKDLALQKAEQARQRAGYYTTIWAVTSGLLLAIGIGVFVFYRRLTQQKHSLIESQNEVLALQRENLASKEALLAAQKTENELRHSQLENEIALKENQLSALTLQMVKKTELIDEFQNWVDNMGHTHDKALQKLLNKSVMQDSEWDNFNQYFGAVNQHFYEKLKRTFPDISPNDQKLCALIRMNLSIKEMAMILGISADSVKTARYRLRKKLQLETEENLTNFIANI